MIDANIKKIEQAVDRFTQWLDCYGEVSYDHQSFFAGPGGRAAKALYYRKPMLGTLVVAPMIFFEAFVPSARSLFWKPQRFPIADAHYAMGFSFLARISGDAQYRQRAVHFLEVLKDSRSPGYEDYCWGYPFDWETRGGTFRANSPLITTLPYAYEAFSAVYAIDENPKWREVMRSIAEHGLNAYRDLSTGPDAASCGYTTTPDDPCGVINASAYRAFLLTQAGADFSDPRYQTVARRNLNFVLAAQNENGSWYYSTDAVRDFVDHFHTCFVLKALAKIHLLTGCAKTWAAIERGVDYYVRNLFDTDGRPKPFSKPPRLTVYRHELYDYAECINLGVLLQGHFPDLDRNVSLVIADLLERWQQPDGAFRARKLLLGWDNVPMHRWAQSQIFRSLVFFLASKRSVLPAGKSDDAVLSQSGT
jgi:hypothetical protein